MTNYLLQKRKKGKKTYAKYVKYAKYLAYLARLFTASYTNAGFQLPVLLDQAHVLKGTKTRGVEPTPGRGCCH